jgi:hypothetical protein
VQPVVPEKTDGPQIEVRAALAFTPGSEVLLSSQVFIVTVISTLLCASASAGFAIGLLLFRVEAIVIASLFLALLCAALLPYHGFGLAGDVLISVELLAALQSFYFAGKLASRLVRDDQSKDHTCGKQSS